MVAGGKERGPGYRVAITFTRPRQEGLCWCRTGTCAPARDATTWLAQDRTFKSPRHHQRGASNKNRNERDRFRGSAVSWYSPGKTSHSISRLGYARPRSSATMRSVSAT